MARLASAEKMLYYPLQQDVAERILRHIKWPHGIPIWNTDTFKANVFDPCVGEGLFLEALVEAFTKKCERTEFIPWGVELDDVRAAEAKTRLGERQVLHAAIENTAVVGQADVLYINPPYDTVGGKREELRFLRMTKGWLKDGGIFIAILPGQFFNDGPEAKRLQDTLQDLGISSVTVWRLPDEYFAAFKQHVLIGRKSTTAYIYPDALTSRGIIGEYIPELDKYAWQGQRAEINRGEWLDMYGTYPGTRAYSPLTLIRRKGDANAVSVFADSNFKLLYPTFGNPTAESGDFTPLMPMGDRHAAEVVIAGMLNGVTIGDYVYRGTVEKWTMERKEETGEKGTYKVHKTEYFVSVLTRLNLKTAEIETFNDQEHPDEFNDIILQNAQVFIDAAHRMFPPRLTPKFLTWAAKHIEQVRAPNTPLPGKADALLPKQIEIAAGMLRQFRDEKVGTIGGEMSTGKTGMALAAMAVKAQLRKPGSRNIVVMLPPKADLLTKWKREAERALANFVNPDGSKGPRVTIVEGARDVQNAFAYDGLNILLIKDTTAKNTSGFVNVLPRYGRWQKLDSVSVQDTYRFEVVHAALLHNFAEEDLRIVTRDSKKHIYGRVWTVRCNGWREVNGERKPCNHVFGADELTSLIGENPDRPMKFVCPYCHTPHWQATGLNTRSKRQSSPYQSYGAWEASKTHEDYSDNGRYALAKLIRDHYPNRYMLIIDEAHNTKSADSNASYAATDLVSGAYKVIQMTGTIYNGKPSSLFFLLYRAYPWFRELYNYDGVQLFVDAYGLFEQITTYLPERSYGSVSGYKEINNSPKEVEGVAPGMSALLLRGTAFVTLEDLKFSMPEYSEHTVFVPIEPELHRKYERFMDQVWEVAVEAAKKEDHKPMGEYRAAVLGLLDAPWLEDEVAGQKWTPLPFPMTAEMGDEKGLWNKERALFRILQKEKAEGRKSIVFISQINRRDPTPRWMSLLPQFGLKGVVMKADVKKRVDFIAAALEDGCDVIFTSAPLVKEGVDLEMLHTIIWWGVEYNIYVLPQANRRLYRLNQRKPVRVYYLGWNETVQAQKFAYVARKLAGQQRLHGDLRNGLAGILVQDDFVDKLQREVSHEKPRYQQSDVDWMTLPRVRVVGADGKFRVVPEEPTWTPGQVERANKRGTEKVVQYTMLF